MTIAVDKDAKNQNKQIGGMMNLNISTIVCILKFISETRQGSHRLQKYLNLEGFLEKSLKTKSALKSTGKSLKSLKKSLNSTFFL